MWFKDKFFRYAAGIIMILTVVFLLGQIEFVFEPVKKFFAILFIPLLVSLLLYYLLRPLVRALEKLKINRAIAIFIVYLAIIGIFILLGTYAGSIISKQFNQLSKDLPNLIQSGIDKGAEIIKENNLGGAMDGNFQNQLTSSLQDLAPKITGSIVDLLSKVPGIVTVFIMIPFILFYLLKDDRLFLERLLKIIPNKIKDETISILKETDKTLSIYIIGQGLIAAVLGILTYIGYLIIGMPYALILAIFAMLTSLIPLFGSAIGIFPALLVSLAVDPWMALKVIIIAIIINQLEGNLISPNLVGKRLDIHPLTLIILFLVVANFFGFVGMLIGVPVYAVCRVILNNALRIYRLRKQHLTQQ